MSIVTLTTDNFDEVITNNQIVVIDFWAKWCGPCKTFAEIFAKVATEFPDIVFAKINIEEQSQLAEDFQVRSIPLLMVLKEQIAIFLEAGTMPAVALRELIQQAQSLDMAPIKQQIAAEAGQAE